MAERAHLDWFREKVAASREIEPKDPAPILKWRESRRDSIQFKADLIGLDEVRGWLRDARAMCVMRAGSSSASRE
jgi:dTDP-4-dehydro-6-deoxy-alpha-D-glucopyranose 2,3-dehydratase